MTLVDTIDGEPPRAPHEGTYIAPSGHRAWFPEGAPLLGGYVPEKDHRGVAEAELKSEPAGSERRTRETGTQRRKRETAD